MSVFFCITPKLIKQKIEYGIKLLGVAIIYILSISRSRATNDGRVKKKIKVTQMHISKKYF